MQIKNTHFECLKLANGAYYIIVADMMLACDAQMHESYVVRTVKMIFLQIKELMKCSFVILQFL